MAWRYQMFVLTFLLAAPSCAGSSGSLDGVPDGYQDAPKYDSSDAGVASSDVLPVLPTDSPMCLQALAHPAHEGPSIRRRATSDDQWEAVEGSVVIEADLTSRATDFRPDGVVDEVLLFQGQDGGEIRVARRAVGPPLEFVPGTYRIRYHIDSSIEAIVLETVRVPVWSFVAYHFIPEALDVEVPSGAHWALRPVGVCENLLVAWEGCDCAGPVGVTVDTGWAKEVAVEGQQYLTGGGGDWLLLVAARFGNGCANLSYETGSWVERP